MKNIFIVSLALAVAMSLAGTSWAWAQTTPPDGPSAEAIRQFEEEFGAPPAAPAKPAAPVPTAPPTTPPPSGGTPSQGDVTAANCAAFTAVPSAQYCSAVGDPNGKTLCEQCKTAGY